ncbi:MAG: ATP-binding cassette domain-containing protein, partial [Acidobacteria bacterium]|nr:ATP-binding cassette domain-containing protein [Acidobacteriota bacterium]
MVFRLDQVGVSFANGDQRREVLRDIAVEIKSGEFVSVLGPSGCGKTTLLRLLTGALKPDSGRIDREPERGDG